MPNFAIVHGDEEAIEACSDRWFEALDEHCTGNMGEIDPVTAAEIIDQTRDALLEDYSPEDVDNGYLVAINTFKDRVIMESYGPANPEWPYGQI